MKRLAISIFASCIIATSFVLGQSLSEQSTGSIPVAIPILSQEEADRINAEILDRNEPLHDLYKDSLLDKVVFEGTVRAISSVPDPQKSDYQNCLYTVFVEIDALYSDSPLSHDIACEIVLNVPIFKNKKTIDENIFMPGDKIVCVCAEYDAMPQEIQEIQLSDDIQCAGPAKLDT